LPSFENLGYCQEEMGKLQEIHAQVTSSLERHRFKEALRSVMSAAQLGNQMLQGATPWKFLNDLDGEGAEESMAKLSFGWRLSRYLAILTNPFLPFSAQRLWSALGESGDVSLASWDSAIDWSQEYKWNDAEAKPLFQRLDLDEIISQEKSLADSDVPNTTTPGHGVKGGKKKNKEVKEMPEGTTYLNFETFMEVELKVGKITEVSDHDNADKLYVVSIDDGTDEGRTICAGLKEYYSADEMTGKSVVFVANLKPRKLRGVMSEGMILAADDGNGGVKLVTIDGEITPGSQVR
jgi:methionyl-tRNA synthetase